MHEVYHLEPRYDTVKYRNEFGKYMYIHETFLH